MKSFRSSCASLGIVVLVCDLFSLCGSSNSSSLVTNENIPLSINRNKRAITLAAVSGVVGFVSSALSIYEFLHSQFSSEDEDKWTQLAEDFSRVDRNLQQLRNDISSIREELGQVMMSISYAETEDNIKKSSWALTKYLNSTSADHLKEFCSHASTLEHDLKKLVEGILGLHDFSSDILAATRIQVDCHANKLRKKMSSFNGLVDETWKLYAAYGSSCNISDNTYFKSWFDAKEKERKKRLMEEVDECRNERNVTKELERLLTETHSSPGGLEGIKDAILKFLADKYDTKEWVVVVRKTNENHCFSTHILFGYHFHTFIGQGHHIVAHSSDPNEPGFEDSLQQLCWIS